MGAQRHSDGMNINMYVINAVLVLMVIGQIREHPLELRSLAAPVLAVGCAAVLFLHSVPGGNNLALELACVLAREVMAGRCRSAVWPPRDRLRPGRGRVVMTAPGTAGHTAR